MYLLSLLSMIGHTTNLTVSQLAPLLMTGDFLYFAVIFFILAIIAAAVGARGVAGVTMTVAKWFVIIFIILAILALLL